MRSQQDRSCRCAAAIRAPRGTVATARGSHIWRMPGNGAGGSQRHAQDAKGKRYEEGILLATTVLLCRLDGIGSVSNGVPLLAIFLLVDVLVPGAGAPEAAIDAALHVVVRFLFRQGGKSSTQGIRVLLNKCVLHRLGEGWEHLVGVQAARAEVGKLVLLVILAVVNWSIQRGALALFALLDGAVADSLDEGLEVFFEALDAIGVLLGGLAEERLDHIPGVHVLALTEGQHELDEEVLAGDGELLVGPLPLMLACPRVAHLVLFGQVLHAGVESEQQEIALGVLVKDLRIFEQKVLGGFVRAQSRVLVDKRAVHLDVGIVLHVLVLGPIRLHRGWSSAGGWRRVGHERLDVGALGNDGVVFAHIADVVRRELAGGDEALQLGLVLLRAVLGVPEVDEELRLVVTLVDLALDLLGPFGVLFKFGFVSSNLLVLLLAAVCALLCHEAHP
mmetsp:Transcript_10992/g.34993  ORF Transcript_10992/g.34993 Transcript_10992/m.34993 type:complete len:447 (+) Transcript_10992:1502-2842(+)